MLGSNPNILRNPPSNSLIPEQGITITIKPADLLPPEPQPGITVQPEDGEAFDSSQSFQDALALAINDTMPEKAAFWEWLEREVEQNLDAFKDDEVPYSLLRFMKRSG